MSLGNVSSPRVNEQYFHEALGYLRAASEMQGYSLPAHLQQYAKSENLGADTDSFRYLEEYGPLDPLN